MNEEVYKKWGQNLAEGFKPLENLESFESIVFPVAIRIVAKTLSADLVTVKPMSEPSGINWADFTYTKPLTNEEKYLKEKLENFDY